VIYVDTSALVKLVLEEAETEALRRFLAGVDQEHLITSALSRTELLRAAQRRDGATVEKAREVLDSIAAITITQAPARQCGGDGSIVAAQLGRHPPRQRHRTGSRAARVCRLRRSPPRCRH
jgi:uncharacterized protein with PIN domain